MGSGTGICFPLVSSTRRSGEFGSDAGAARLSGRIRGVPLLSRNDWSRAQARCTANMAYASVQRGIRIAEMRASGWRERISCRSAVTIRTSCRGRGKHCTIHRREVTWLTLVWDFFPFFAIQRRNGWVCSEQASSTSKTLAPNRLSK